MASSKAQPIIVIKKKSGHGGHHGGAWKVAYADFVTAMMALFIVLWLMGSSEKVKKAVAGYFNDPKGTANLLGTTMAGNGVAVTTATSDNMQKLKEKLEKEIKARKDLEKLSKQIEITITPEGLRIELIEDKNGTFYKSGSAHLSDNGQELLALLAAELKTLPNNLLIEGHTDATKYSSDASYTNWELSADRANSARRLMQQDGVRSDQVTQVRGYADQLLRVKNDPYDPSNRRVSILVKNQEGEMANLKEAVSSNGPGVPPDNHLQPGTVDSTVNALRSSTTSTPPASISASYKMPSGNPLKPNPQIPTPMSKLKGMMPGPKK
jgi:chemotaxis protein MotB